MVSIIQDINKNLVASELISCAYCNMNCRYCYIIKRPELVDVHKEIIELLKDGTLIKNLYKIYGDKLTHLSIWGTEPTLTLPYVTEKLNYILELFPKLEKISMSTNMLSKTEVIYDFIDELNKITMNWKNDIEYHIQISLDGPKEITDINRKENSTEIIISNILKLMTFLSNIDLNNNLIISLSFKPTMSIENIDFFINQNGIEKYFDFFEDIFKNVHSILKNKKNIKFPGFCATTLMLPGFYTTDDGKKYAQFIESIYQKNIEDNKNKKYKYIFRIYTGYLIDLIDTLDSLNTINFNTHQYTCSAGDSMIGLDQFSNIHMCHSTYNLVNEKYMQNLYLNKNDESFNVSHFDKLTTEFLKDKYIVNSTDEYNISRIMTVYRGFHDFIEMRIGYTKTLIRELALCGQINDDYLHNDDLITLFAIFLNKRFSCPYNNLTSTMSIHNMGTSLIRLWGNGAFQTMIKYLSIFRRG